MGALQRQGCLSIRTDLQGAHLFVLDRSALALLQAKPALADIKQVSQIIEALAATSGRSLRPAFSVESIPFTEVDGPVGVISSDVGLAHMLCAHAAGAPQGSCMHQSSGVHVCPHQELVTLMKLHT